MDQNTNPAQQGGTFDPFAAAQGAQQGVQAGGGGTSAGGTDPNATTPPWLSFNPAGDAAQNPPVNPWEQFSAPANDTTPPWEAPQATPMSNPWEQQVQTPQNPWEQQSAQQPAPTVAPNPWEAPQEAPMNSPWDQQPQAAVQNPWEAPQETPMSNPWEQQEQTSQNPWEQQSAQQPAPIQEENISPVQDFHEQDMTQAIAPEEQWQDHDTTSTAAWDTQGQTQRWDDDDSKKSSEDLLSELKRRFEEEEAEVAEQILVHENNIKEEQEAIRMLKANRRSQVANMKHMFEELKVILKIEREEKSEGKEVQQKNPAPAPMRHTEDKPKAPHKPFTPKTFKEKPPIKSHPKAA